MSYTTVRAAVLEKESIRAAWVENIPRDPCGRFVMSWWCKSCVSTFRWKDLSACAASSWRTSTRKTKRWVFHREARCWNVAKYVKLTLLFFLLFLLLLLFSICCRCLSTASVSNRFVCILFIFKAFFKRCSLITICLFLLFSGVWRGSEGTVLFLVIFSGAEQVLWESQNLTTCVYEVCATQVSFETRTPLQLVKAITVWLIYAAFKCFLRFCSPQSAARQGNRLQMNVYESRGTTGRVPGPVPGPGLSHVKSGSLTEPKKGFRPPQHCPSLAQAVSRKVQAAVPEEGLVRIPKSAVFAARRCFRGNRCLRRRAGVAVPISFFKNENVK